MLGFDTQPSGVRTLDFNRYLALLLDLDGVITQTDRLHAAAWKRLFDEYLARHAGKVPAAVRPFDDGSDYQLYIDGKPRAEGVKGFLDSRGLAMAPGSPDDGPDRDTIQGLARRKDVYFEDLLSKQGVQVYTGTLRLLRLARGRGLKTAVVSSSHHCGDILRAAGLTQDFDTWIDGHDIDRLGLKGKPAPDTFLEAARRLDAPPATAIVAEDAQAGVEAARAAGVGLVIGVNRRDQAEALRRHGADIVVSDLADLLPSGQQG